MSAFVTAAEAVRFIKSNDRVFIHSIAAAPQPRRAPTRTKDPSQSIALYPVVS
jgi:hypothetical protein